MRYWRKASRDVIAMRGRAILLVLVMGVGIGTAVGISLALHDVQATRDVFYRDYALPDLDARLTQPAPDGVLVARARAAGATRAAVRLILDGVARLPSGDRPAAELVGMSPLATLDRLALLHGRALTPDDPTGVVIEADFAKSAHLGVGDRLSVDVAGRALSLRVRGLARSPEYLLATANPAYLIPQPGSLAVVFMPLNALQRLTGQPGQVNDVVVDFAGGPSASRSNHLVAGLSLATITPRSQQYSYRFTNADIRSFSLFAPVIGAVFAAVGFLLLVLSLRRLVGAQRRELGALLALGYPPRAVVLTAVLPAVILGVGGAFIAAAAASAVAYLVSTEYAAAVGFPHVVHTQAPAFLLVAAGSALLTTLLAATIPAASLARLRPSEAMRGEAAADFDVPARLRDATSHGGPTLTYAMRTLLRRRAQTAATCISLAIAIGIGAALAILATSVNRAVDASFTQQGWSYMADFGRPVPLAAARMLAARAGVTAAEPVIEGPAQLVSATAHSATSQLVGIPAGASLDHLAMVVGAPPTSGRIVLSEQLASQLRVRTGERITAITATGRQRLTVGGIVRTLASQQAFLPEAQAGRLLGLPGVATSLYVAGDTKVASLLLADTQVTYVVSKAAALNDTHQLVRELSGLIDVMLAISLGVGALFLVSSLAMSFLDRQGEFATLRALGNGRRQIGAMVAAESLSQTLVGAVLSAPAAILIAWPLARRIGQAWFQITVAPSPDNFLIPASAAVVLALLATFQAQRQIMRANIATTVRARMIA